MVHIPEPRDISQVFDHYRLSARSIWNTAFWPDPDFRNWDSVERFQEVEKILFEELVLAKLERSFPSEDIFRKPIPFFRISPSSQSVPIMIQNPRPGISHGYWDEPVDRVRQDQAEMHFLRFFDWNSLDYRDLQYYHVVITAFNEQPQLAGREALIERQYVTVFLQNQ